MLEQACHDVEDVISEVDAQTGEAKCQFTKSKLEYLDDKQKNRLIDESQVILCDGVLKNNRGTVCMRGEGKGGIREETAFSVLFWDRFEKHVTKIYFIRYLIKIKRT